MRDAENESHEGKRKAESLWPIMRISHARSRYIYELYYKREAVSRELYDWLLKEGYADAKWVLALFLTILYGALHQPMSASSLNGRRQATRNYVVCAVSRLGWDYSPSRGKFTRWFMTLGTLGYELPRIYLHLSCSQSPSTFRHSRRVCTLRSVPVSLSCWTGGFTPLQVVAGAVLNPDSWFMMQDVQLTEFLWTINSHMSRGGCTWGPLGYLKQWYNQAV